MCVNDEHYVQEQMYYMQHLELPAEYTLEVIPIRNAASMTSGYNRGMMQSDAKYKIYIHQDVFIVYEHMIEKLLYLFQNEQIGMIGMVGTPCLPENSIMWEKPRCGRLYYNAIYEAGESWIGKVKEPYQEVEAIDGFFMATQYDIWWREDVFDKWDFYDISQCMEFRKKGWKIIVPHTDTSWCIHDDGFMNLKYYFEERRKFRKEYRNGTNRERE